MQSEPLIEEHPFEPYIPADAKILIMGTFPPQPKRWSMNFYYPNRTNDFWFMIGLIFLCDKHALYNLQEKRFNLEAIKQLLEDKGIALHDTARRIRRLKDNASDKFLDIVQPVPLDDLLLRMPHCHTLATTGEKAAGIIADLTSTPQPKMGEMVITDKGLEIWRMPSTSRAYPLQLEKKAEYYATMFRYCGIL